MTHKTEFEIGDKVYDDLTGEETEVIGRIERDGVLSRGYKVKSQYLGGYRYEWEVSKIVKQD